MNWRDARRYFLSKWDAAHGQPSYQKRRWIEAESSLFAFAPEAYMVRPSGLTESHLTQEKIDEACP